MGWYKLLHYLTVLCGILSEILEEAMKHKHGPEIITAYRREEGQPLLDPGLARRARP